MDVAALHTNMLRKWVPVASSTKDAADRIGTTANTSPEKIAQTTQQKLFTKIGCPEATDRIVLQRMCAEVQRLNVKIQSDTFDK